MIFLALALTAMPQAAVRARMAETGGLTEKEEQDARKVRNYTIPGFDISDSSVLRSAIHYCGVTPSCSEQFTTARDKLVIAGALHGKTKEITKYLRLNTDAEHTNWGLVGLMLTEVKGWARAPISTTATVTCHSFSTSRSTYSTCRVR